jgi:hypothetical protein
MQSARPGRRSLYAGALSNVIANNSGKLVEEGGGEDSPARPCPDGRL